MQGFKITQFDIEPSTPLSSQLHSTCKVSPLLLPSDTPWGWRQPSTLHPLGYLLSCSQAQSVQGTFWQVLVGTLNPVFNEITLRQSQRPNSNCPLKDVLHMCFREQILDKDQRKNKLITKFYFCDRNFKIFKEEAAEYKFWV